ncbi:helix-turn-helix domain-containing protein [Paenibacillus sp. BAC0078]
MDNERKVELIAFGKALKQIRKMRGYTQEQLSLYSRVDRSFISELETGEKAASFLTILSLCKVLNIKPSELISKFEELITEIY